ncbi:hypothetical protein ACFOG5_15405 [Pedobacter fastidiosus]|uniref:Uncharacterized protein n=2 Tax=Pedobacter fastidiosus TaxID=2765361 RepID=A0ABR7KRA9_9SPHI|nr:hypothetical protein [Pedobacter fastidiosus]
MKHGKYFETCLQTNQDRWVFIPLFEGGAQERALAGGGNKLLTPPLVPQKEDTGRKSKMTDLATETQKARKIF